MGCKKPNDEPCNSYLYNNTVYVKDGQRSVFAVTVNGTTRNIAAGARLGRFEPKVFPAR